MADIARAREQAESFEQEECCVVMEPKEREVPLGDAIKTLKQVRVSLPCFCATSPHDLVLAGSLFLFLPLRDVHAHGLTLCALGRTCQGGWQEREKASSMWECAFFSSKLRQLGLPDREEHRDVWISLLLKAIISFLSAYKLPVFAAVKFAGGSHTGAILAHAARRAGRSTMESPWKNVVCIKAAQMIMFITYESIL